MQYFKKLCAHQTDVGLFLVRVGVAVVFIAHGWAKLAGMEGTIGFFAMLGLPALLAYAVAAIEFLGGIAMLLGVGTRIAGMLLAIVMVGAIFTVKLSKGLMGGYEFDLVLLLASLGISFTGGGKYQILKDDCGVEKPKETIA